MSRRPCPLTGLSAGPGLCYYDIAFVVLVVAVDRFNQPSGDEGRSYRFKANGSFFVCPFRGGREQVRRI